MVRLKTRLVPARQIAFSLCCAVWFLLAAGCATPVSVERVGARTIQGELTANALTADELSPSARNVLRRWVLSERYDSDPEGAIAALHIIAIDGRGGTDELVTGGNVLSVCREEPKAAILPCCCDLRLCVPVSGEGGPSRRAPTTRACASPPTYTTSALSRALPRLTALPSRSGMGIMSCPSAGSP